MSIPNFFSLTCRNHEESEIAQIKPCSIFERDLHAKRKLQEKKLLRKLQVVFDRSNSSRRKEIQSSNNGIGTNYNFDSTLSTIHEDKVELEYSRNLMFPEFSLNYELHTSNNNNQVPPLNRIIAEEKRKKQTKKCGNFSSNPWSLSSSSDLLVNELVAKTPTFSMLKNKGNFDSGNPDEKEKLLPHLRLSYERRKTLEERRKIQEAEISPLFHAIELEPWNTKIDWVGYTANKNNNNDLKEGKSPNGGVLLDPMNLLFQKRNSELESLDLRLIPSIWSGVEKNPHLPSKPHCAPLILHESEAGTSIAHLAMPQQRPLSFDQSHVYEQRVTRVENKIAGGSTLAKRTEETEEFQMKQQKRAALEEEKKKRVTNALGSLELGGGKGRNITSSLMGPGGTERTGRPSRHENSSSAHDAEMVEQLELIYNHSLVKADRRIMELRQLNRPRLSRKYVRGSSLWKFQLLINASSVKNKRGGSSVHVIEGSANVIGMAARRNEAKIHNVSDLSAACNGGELVLFEYCEEKPPLQLVKGMACRVVNYYRGDKNRCPVSAGGGDRPTRKRVYDSKRTEDKIDRNKAKSGTHKKRIKPPKLKGPDASEGLSMMDLMGVCSLKSGNSSNSSGDENPKNNETKNDESKSTNGRKQVNAVHILPEGVTEVLHPKVHGPFIGEIETGTTQSGLISNLFAAPIFQHKLKSTDFLIILGGKKPKSMSGMVRDMGQDDRRSDTSVLLRSFPQNVFTVGQTEPRVKISAPNATMEKDFLKSFVTFQIAKALEIQQRKDQRHQELGGSGNNNGLRLDDIKECLFPYSSHLMPNYLRQRLKQVANHDTKSQMWTLKSIGEGEYPGLEILERSFAPEAVVAYESARATVQHLIDIGIVDLDWLGGATHAVSNVGTAMIYLNGAAAAARSLHMKMKKNRDFAQREAQKSSKKTAAKLVAYFDKAVVKLKSYVETEKHIQSVARFIYEELQLTPWHLTSEFIDVHKHNLGTAMMKLTGLGDPSGRGEAFNFLREVDGKPNKETGNSDGALNAQIKKITGTENDLRRLTMKQMSALLLSYGLDQKYIDTLKRWDRVHVIREVSTRVGDGSNPTPDGLESRFARGEKMKLSDQKQMYRDRIQEIWRRQIAALTTTSIPSGVESNINGNDNDDESDFDLDDDDYDEEENNKNVDNKKNDDNDEDDDDEDDFYNDLVSEIVDERAVGGLVNRSSRTSSAVGMPSETSTEDAIELRQWQRQLKEERKAKERFETTGDAESNVGADINAPGEETRDGNLGRIIIKRKITRIHADGRIETRFRFIVLQKDVDKINEQRRKRTSTKNDDPSNARSLKSRVGKNTTRTKIKKDSSSSKDSSNRKWTGHSIFEEDDDKFHSQKTNITFHLRQQTRVVTSKPRKSKPLTPKELTNTTPNSKKGLSKQMKQSKMREQQRLKRRKREADDADVYRLSSQRKGTNNRRERGAARERMPHVILAQRFEKIRSDVESRPSSGPFHRPVSRTNIPQYYEIISNPIDLQTIRDKNARYEYRTVDAFLKDFTTMQNNAIRFNGRDSILGEEAVEIREYVNETIESSSEEFKALEEAVKKQLSSSTRTKKAKTDKGSKSNASSNTTSESSTTANIMLDGVSTTVNLGDISNNFEESDSD